MVQRPLNRGRSRAVGLFYALMLLAATPVLIFAAYVYHVRTSPFITSLERRSAAYPRIGRQLFPNRASEQPAVDVARRHLLDGTRRRSPSLGWHFEFAATHYAVEAAFDAQEVNRMYAALPISKYRGFDDVALSFAGQRFCSLDERRKEAVREFSRSPRGDRLRALLAASGPA